MSSPTYGFISFAFQIGLNNSTGGKDSPQAMKASLEVGKTNRALYYSRSSQFPDHWMPSTGDLRVYNRTLVRVKFMSYIVLRHPQLTIPRLVARTRTRMKSLGPILSTVLMVRGRGSDGSTPGTPHSTSSSSKSRTNVGAIAGGVIGAVFAALIIVFVWLRYRKVRRQAAASALDSRFLRIEDYYATQDASPPSSTHQVNPLPVSVDRSIFKGGAPVPIF